MSDKSDVRSLLAQHWQMVATASGCIASALKLYRDWRVSGSPSVEAWLLVSLTVGVLMVIRYPRVAVALTQLLLGPSAASEDGPRIFRGLIPYLETDDLPGRSAEAEDCRRLVRASQFVVIDGEVGCGKSSLLNAAVIPSLSGTFQITKITIHKEDLPRLPEFLKNFRPNKSDTLILRVPAPAPTSILLFIDQFESIFLLAPDEERLGFMRNIRDAVAAGVHIVVAIRSDFTDLLLKLCRAADPTGDILNLGLLYTIPSFASAKSTTVIESICKPLCKDDPALRQQVHDFALALTADLLRPPRDPRLNSADAPTVLPAELQIIGATLESLGTQYLSARGLAAAGGKSGLLRKYVDRATAYVFRRTGVASDDALLVLRHLVTSSRTKQERSPSEIRQFTSNLTTNQIDAVLSAFSEISMTKRVPAHQGVLSGYELMHDHLINLFLDAPAPVLIRAQDAEERLRFWHDRDAAQQSMALSNIQRSRLRRITELLRQPVPLLETTRLWRFALADDDRALLKRSLRAVAIRTALAVVVAPLAALFVTRTELYQTWRIVREARAAQVAEAANVSEVVRASKSHQIWLDGTTDFEVFAAWGSALTSAGYIRRAIDSAEYIRDPYLRARMLLTIAHKCEAKRNATCMDECLRKTRQLVLSIQSLGLKSVVWANMALVFAQSDSTVSREAADEAMKVSDDTSEPYAIAETASLLSAEGNNDQARQLWIEVLTRPFAFQMQDILRMIARSGRRNDDLILSAVEASDPIIVDDLVGTALVTLADLGDAMGVHEGIDLAFKKNVSSAVFAKAILAAHVVGIQHNLVESKARALRAEAGNSVPPIGDSLSSYVMAILAAAHEREAALEIGAKVGSRRTRDPQLIDLSIDAVGGRPDDALREFDTLRDIPDGPPYNQWRDVVVLAVSDGLAAHGKTQSALSILGRIPEGDYHSVALCVVLSRTADYVRQLPRETRLGIGPGLIKQMATESAKIGDYNLKSLALGQLGIAYAEMGDYVSARALAQTALPTDELRIYTAVLNNYIGEKVLVKSPEYTFPFASYERPVMEFDNSLEHNLSRAQEVVSRIVGGR